MASQVSPLPPIPWWHFRMWATLLDGTKVNRSFWVKALNAEDAMREVVIANGGKNPAPETRDCIEAGFQMNRYRVRPRVEPLGLTEEQVQAGIKEER